jgi:peptidoglycan/LPS O-acetylase OafA/YrhL
VRAVAILLVVGHHWVTPFTGLFKLGAVGVDVFFVLSGYLITGILAKTPPESRGHRAYVAFVVRRVQRLYPALVGVILGGGALYLWMPGAGGQLGEVLRNAVIALLQGTFVSVSISGAWDSFPYGHTWSLGAEWAFYLVWPFLLWAWLGNAARRERPVALRVALAGLVLTVVGMAFPNIYTYVNPLFRSGEMLLGGSLALGMAALRSKANDPVMNRLRRLQIPIALALVLLAAAPGPSANDYRLYFWVAVPLSVAFTMTVIALGALGERGRLMELLESRPMVWVGTISYSLYLWHIPVFYSLDSSGLGLSKPVVGLLGVVLSLVLSVLSYRYLEAPALRRPRTESKSEAVR